MNDYVIEAIIEIPMGTKNKYEIDKFKNRIKLNRVLYSAMTYPAEYGYIENTLALDGDPLDILVLASTKTFPGCVIDARVIGYLDMIDNGERDEKIIAVVDQDPRYDDIHNINDVQSHILREVKHFFKTYKSLQTDYNVVVNEYYDKQQAIDLINTYKKAYRKN